MNIQIIGINDHKIRVGMRNLLNAYAPYFQSLQGEDRNQLFFHLITSADTVAVIVKDDRQKILLERQAKLPSEQPDRVIKYAVLQALFDILSQITNYRLPWGVLSGIRPTKLVHHYKSLGMSDEQIHDHLMNFYYLSSEKAEELIRIVNHQLVSMLPFSDLKREISVYINIPYCVSRCTYCSFTAYLRGKTRVMPNQYVEALCDEIRRFKRVVEDLKLRITTVYIGGGTPTALTRDELAKVLLEVEHLIEGQNLLEYTLEAGRPDTIDEEKLKLIKGTSVTRISINPQTFHEETLSRVNRQHSVQAIYDAFFLARAMGFNRINMDLIVGLPGEKPLDYLESLNHTIALQPESITVHALAIKRRAALRDDYDLSRLSQDFSDAFQEGKKRLHAADYVPYYLYRQKNIMSGLENIGYGKKGEVSPYNILMIEEAQTIIGLGCGASSKFLDYDLILNPWDLSTYLKTYRDYLERKAMKLKGCEWNG